MFDYRENLDLVRRYQVGDAAAGGRIVTLNERLVYNMAHRYRAHAGLLEFEDLVQEGRIALLYAARKFQPERGWQFSTYAIHWIRGAISRAVKEEALATQRPYPVRPCAQRTSPSADLIADARDEMQDRHDRIFAARMLTCHDRLFAAQMLDGLDSPTERAVIEIRYGLGGRPPGTLSAVGETLGISRAGVRQIEARALRKLRAMALG
jgi:RNA polymerase sigma factor (sigma-70 family)